jgi:hypothetical protein
MAKKTKPVPHAREVYRQAMRFLTVDGYLRTNALQDEVIRFYAQVPGMVLSVFASELLLKTLLILEGKGHLATGHDLKTLYDHLNAFHRAEIQIRWDADQTKRKDEIDAQERKYKGKIRIPRDLPTALSDCGGAFVILRYLHENPKKAKFYITFFPHAVRDVIRRITGWNE